MSITLAPEVEAKLRARANRRGVDVHALANELINSALILEDEDPAAIVAALEEGFRAIDEGRVRPLHEFAREHYERWPDAKD